MIKYNLNTINDWNFGDDNIIKVYRNNAVVYYKVSSSGDAPQWKVCYAVVDDISQYQDTEFEDVYDKASNKWYKLNNLNQYEEYGLYGDGRNVTTYEGKLTVDDGYEYEWDGSQWVSVGEITGSTASLPDIPFSVNYNARNYDSSTNTLLKTEGQLVDVDAVITAGTPTVNDGYLTISIATRATISGYQQYFNRTASAPNLTIISKQSTNGSDCHMFANRHAAYNWMYRVYSSHLTLHGSSEQGSLTVTTQPVIESVRVTTDRTAIYNNYTDGTTSSYSNFSYGSTNGGKFALFQGYAVTTGEYFHGDFYWVYMSQNTLSDEQVQKVIDYNESAGKMILPVEYTEKAAPLNNLTFNTIEEANTYARTNCVYDGMKATINGEKYNFVDGIGWELVAAYYVLEDAIQYAESAWSITNSSTYNPNMSLYDDYTCELTSGYQGRFAKVTIYGYESFTFYLRTSGYSDYMYATCTNIDELASVPNDLSPMSPSAITNTYLFNREPKSNVNLNNYRRITFNNLDKTVEHTFYVFARSNYYNNSYSYNATVLIPKDQDSENWEQVEFSASTNVGGAKKNLYIDNNQNTDSFYYRWNVGLPSGTHSSYVDYGNFDYCPIVSSSTFTSVAGEQRQVNFTYDTVQKKTLTLIAVDGSGNMLLPCTISYNLTNTCNKTRNVSGADLPYTISDVPVGGSINFGSYYDKHYIYGYQPNISFYTNYQVDLYTQYFEIPYTKLATEAVTITYTTYDPSDTETPAFNTDITYPYNYGTTSSTTLTSFDVPYTYSYEIKQASDMFSTATQSYTAGQASRTINFTLYPNNREFSTVTDLESYAYAWEGMKATVGDDKYTYENGEWVVRSYVELEYIETVINSLNSGLQLPTVSQEGYVYELTCLNGGNNKDPRLLGTKTNSEPICVYEFGLSYYGALGVFIDMGTRISSYQNIYSKSVIRCGQTDSNNHSLYTLTVNDNTYSNNVSSYCISNFKLLVGDVKYNSQTSDTIYDNTSKIKLRIFGLKIWSNYGSTLIANYVPCLDENDSPNLYDTISCEYATPLGTLTAGPEV